MPNDAFRKVEKVPFLRQDTFATGFFTGIAFPTIMYFMVLQINDLIFKPTFGHPFTLSFELVVSVFFNILPFAIYNKARKDKAMKGIMTITFVFAFMLVLMFYRQWMSN
jgi:hypothetical protein